MSERDPFTRREITSRRGGPVKQPLSRDLIVSTALDLLAKEGLSGMSLRKVAAALDTGPASLYVYVEDLDELRTLVLDRALADVKTAGEPGRDGRQRLSDLLMSYVQVLSRSPGLAHVAMSTIAAGPNALRILETLLALLEEAGADPATAAWAADLITLYATAIASELSQRTEDALKPVTRAIGGVSEERHPRIFAAREHLLSGDGLERFRWAQEVLLAGILSTPRAAPTGSKARPRARPKR
ncbi:MAG: TetR/AcrR family transcriptional regulator C-terminal domain-containing protein [Polyangiaceae bacterium]